MSARVLTNLESVGDMIGALQGIGLGLDEDKYMQGLIQQAHGHAASAFNAAAAATASTGTMTHVYEFGTQGITRGLPRYADPMAEDARLWIHTLIGHGGNQDIAYTFRPAVNRNPAPTTAYTGVPSKYLRKLSQRKYVFWNKAFMMETGKPVTIKPRHGDFLFVPFNGEQSRDGVNDRGFVMWDASKKGAIVSRPGQSTKGQFTSFWLKWWSSAGSDMMQAEMSKYVTMDIDKAMVEVAKRAQSETLKPVQQTKVNIAATQARTLFKKLFGTATTKRLGVKTR